MLHYSIRILCCSSKVSRQLYNQHSCRPSSHQFDDQRLQAANQEFREAFAGYGYRRVTKALVRAGWKFNHKRVRRVMKHANLICRRKWCTVHTTDSRHSYQMYSNLVKRLQVEVPNYCWVSDLILHYLAGGFVYLACLLDM